MITEKDFLIKSLNDLYSKYSDLEFVSKPQEYLSKIKKIRDNAHMPFSVRENLQNS